MSRLRFAQIRLFSRYRRLPSAPAVNRWTGKRENTLGGTTRSSTSLYSRHDPSLCGHKTGHDRSALHVCMSSPTAVFRGTKSVCPDPHPRPGLSRLTTRSRLRRVPEAVSMADVDSEPFSSCLCGPLASGSSSLRASAATSVRAEASAPSAKSNRSRRAGGGRCTPPAIGHGAWWSHLAAPLQVRVPGQRLW